jgi:hypothetical protein
VRFELACAERDQALAQSGLPSCAWIEQWEREAPPADAKLERHTAHLERANAHIASCETCQARERFVRERFPDMPKPPMSGTLQVVGTVGNWIDARPEWMRPALYGAALLAAITAFRAAFMLLGAVRNPRLLLLAPAAVALASVAGAGGGLVYAFVGRPARRVPVVGPYLAGVIAVAGYTTCILAIMTVAGGDDSMRIDRAGSLVAFGIVSVLFGLMVGHMWFRPKKGRA